MVYVLFLVVVTITLLIIPLPIFVVNVHVILVGMVQIVLKKHVRLTVVSLKARVIVTLHILILHHVLVLVSGRDRIAIHYYVNTIVIIMGTVVMVHAHVLLLGLEGSVTTQNLVHKTALDMENALKLYVIVNLVGWESTVQMILPLLNMKLSINVILRAVQMVFVHVTVVLVFVSKDGLVPIVLRLLKTMNMISWVLWKRVRKQRKTTTRKLFDRKGKKTVQ